MSHPGPPELLSERLGHGLQHVLGAAVDGEPGAGTDPSLAGDEHHLAPLPGDHYDHHMSLSPSSPGDHGGEQGPGDMQRPPHIDPDTPAPLGDIALDKSVQRRHVGSIVDNTLHTLGVAGTLQ